MSQANELLTSLLATSGVHEHVVTDPDGYFVIDPDTRVITSVGNSENFLMQYDHDSEVYTFEVPRRVEGHDMTLCNRVRVHYINVSSSTSATYADVSEMTDLTVNPEDPSTVISTWLISRNATQLAGNLSFAVQYMCVDDTGEVVYEWHTDIFDKVTIKPSMNNDEQAVIEYSSILEEWYQKLFGAGDSVVAQIETTSAEQQELIKSTGEAQMSAVESKGAETLATIPDDYTTTSTEARAALRTRANAIVETASGETITINDASDDYLRGMKIYGKSTQVTTTGKNLVNLPQVFNKPESGYNYDLFTGTVGQATAIDAEYFDKLPYLTAGTYYINADFEAGTSNTEIKVMAVAEDGTTSTSSILSVVSGVFTIDVDSMVTIRVGTGSATTISNIQIEAGDSYTGYEPYTGGVATPSPEWPQEINSVENPVVNICGKNLIDFSTYSGTDNHAALINAFDFRSIKKGNVYTLSVWLDSAADTIAYWNSASKISGYVEFKVKPGLNRYTYTFTAFADGVLSETPVNVLNKYPTNDGESIVATNAQIEAGELATDYVPFNGKSLELTRTLPGIPVSSGGNYTDANGQQWICDEIDFERGVYVQRLSETIIDGSETFSVGTHENGQPYAVFAQLSKLNGGILSDRYVGGLWTNVNNHVYSLPENIILVDARFTDVDTTRRILETELPKVLYSLATPIETALTDEELFNFSQLHSNFPNTTILNDQNVKMEVSYNADTETWFYNRPVASDEQVQVSVDAWLTAHYSSAEEASF